MIGATILLVSTLMQPDQQHVRKESAEALHKSPAEPFSFETDQILAEKDLALLTVLNEGSAEGLRASVSFQGLRRRLGLHQETLSRLLKRLEGEGMILKLGNQYLLSSGGQRTVSLNAKPIPRDFQKQPVLVLRTILPDDLPVEELEAALSHKWFGDLRWFGSYSVPEGKVLKWITADGNLSLSARISQGLLSISYSGGDAKFVSSAIHAAHDIFGQVSKIEKGPRVRQNLDRSGRVSAA